MNQKILLVEPAYKTKYPPLGLMKISTYHKMKGDEVTFVKGKDSSVKYDFWDRIYISTLFTWTWEETVNTIKFYSETLFGFTGKIFVGGVIASLMPEELYNATGIDRDHIVEGLLNDSAKIQQNDDIIIDNLAPDYEILTQVEKGGFKYSNTDAYIGYTTRGCVWKCKFCAVRTFEPKYVPYVDVRSVVEEIREKYGEKQHLVLMDNNVLASAKFHKIIDDIIALGFRKGATFGDTRKRRTVDFNQGLDARFLTEEKMKRLAEIQLEPMRIAFDSIELKDEYLNAVELAHRYGQKNMSNYILYNYQDTPEDFWERLWINIDLNDKFKKGKGVKTAIYSFPMRFIPLNAKRRDVDTGNPYWNKRYLRGVKVISNVMKGPVMPGKQFFLQAFGRDADEFKAIISMPDAFILKRLVPNWKEIDNIEDRWMPYVKEWMNTYSALSAKEKAALMKVLGPNEKQLIQTEYSNTTNKRIKKLLEFHLMESEIVA